jgi:hypothetical protein
MNNTVGIASSGVVVNQWLFNFNVKWLILFYHSQWKIK